MPQKYTNLSLSDNDFSRPSSSVLDTIGTLPHFCTSNKEKKTHSKDFYTTYYRHRNLDLRSALLNSSDAGHDTIAKTAKALSCCSHLTTLTSLEGSQVTIDRSSPRCKNRYCQICSRIESSVIVRRFMDQIRDENNKPFFKNKSFYFLTFTLKHDENTRSDIYLKDLRSYMSKMVNSKSFKNVFSIEKPKKDFGAYQSIEMTIGKNGYHIHAHMILVSRKLNADVSKCEKVLSDKWLKITKDSSIFRLDLIKTNNTIKNDSKQDQELFNASAELFKYIIKSPDVKKMSDDDMSRLTKWIIETKGKNFINALGYFRHNSIIKSRVKDDDVKKIDDTFVGYDLYIARTIDLKGNYDVKYMMSKSVRTQVLTYFKLHYDSVSMIEISDLLDYVTYMLKSYSYDFTNPAHLIELVETVKAQKSKSDTFEDIFQNQMKEYFSRNKESNRTQNVINQSQ